MNLSLNKPVTQNYQLKNKRVTKRRQTHSLLDKKIALAVHWNLNKRKDRSSTPEHWVLTIHEHFELFVVELRLLQRDQGTLRALAHGVHEAHARQRHFFTAALVTETLPTPSAVVLSTREHFLYLFTRETGREWFDKVTTRVSQVWNLQVVGQAEEINCYSADRNLLRLDTKYWV